MISQQCIMRFLKNTLQNHLDFQNYGLVFFQCAWTHLRDLLDISYIWFLHLAVLPGNQVLHIQNMDVSKSHYCLNRGLIRLLHLLTLHLLSSRCKENPLFLVQCQLWCSTKQIFFCLCFPAGVSTRLPGQGQTFSAGDLWTR